MSPEGKSEDIPSGDIGKTFPGLGRFFRCHTIFHSIAIQIFQSFLMLMTEIFVLRLTES